MKTKYESNPEFWVYFREERDRLERIDRSVAQCHPGGLSMEEIADIMGIPYDSVRTILRRAIIKMRQRARYLQAVGKWD